MHKSESVKTAILGARGYAGLELARLLLRHPGAELKACYAGESSFSLSDYLPEPEAAAVPVLSPSELGRASKLDVVFLATPAEVSVEWAPKLLAEGIDVIDLSGAFRLRTGKTPERVEAYRRWYGFEHSCPELLERAIYGLSPWNHGQQGQGASPRGGFDQSGPAKAANPALIANPGCYATAALMAILPLLSADVIEPGSLVIDAKSGASGAGRKATEALLFNEVEGECLPYKIGKHQHLPEIREACAEFASVDPFFSTTLIPVRRGIIAGIHARLRPGQGADSVARAFTKAYGNYGLVRHGALGAAGALSLKRVVGTARTHLHYEVSGDKLYLFSLIDNLLKGAAGQAVENLNWLYGMPVDSGLTAMEGIL